MENEKQSEPPTQEVKEDMDVDEPESQSTQPNDTENESSVEESQEPTNDEHSQDQQQRQQEQRREEENEDDAKDTGNEDSDQSDEEEENNHESGNENDENENKDAEVSSTPSETNEQTQPTSAVTEESNIEETPSSSKGQKKKRVPPPKTGSKKKTESHLVEKKSVKDFIAGLKYAGSKKTKSDSFRMAAKSTKVLEDQLKNTLGLFTNITFSSSEEKPPININKTYLKKNLQHPGKVRSLVHHNLQVVVPKILEGAAMIAERNSRGTILSKDIECSFNCSVSTLEALEPSSEESPVRESGDSSEEQVEEFSIIPVKKAQSKKRTRSGKPVKKMTKQSGKTSVKKQKPNKAASKVKSRDEDEDEESEDYSSYSEDDYDEEEEEEEEEEQEQEVRPVKKRKLSTPQKKTGKNSVDVYKRKAVDLKKITGRKLSTGAKSGSASTTKTKVKKAGVASTKTSVKSTGIKNKNKRKTQSTTKQQSTLKEKKKASHRIK